MAKLNEQVAELTKRTCRWCGKPYVYPKGGRRPGCPKCQPALWVDERN